MRDIRNNKRDRDCERKGRLREKERRESQGGRQIGSCIYCTKV